MIPKDLNIIKLIDTAQELIADPRISIAATGQKLVQEIKINSRAYKLSVLLEYIPNPSNGDDLSDSDANELQDFGS